MENRKAIKKFIQGTDVRLTTVLREELLSGAMVTITIKDPGDTVVINETSMTEINDQVYQYIYETTTDSTEGIYEAIITVTSGGYSSRERIFFCIEED